MPRPTVAANRTAVRRVSCTVSALLTVDTSIGDIKNALFLKPKTRGSEFHFKNSELLRFSGVFSSTIRTVIGSQFVLENLSTALLF